MVQEKSSGPKFRFCAERRSQIERQLCLLQCNVGVLWDKRVPILINSFFATRNHDDSVRKLVLCQHKLGSSMIFSWFISVLHVQLDGRNSSRDKIYLSISISISIYLSMYLSVYVPIPLSIDLSIYQYACIYL